MLIRQMEIFFLNKLNKQQQQKHTITTTTYLHCWGKVTKSKISYHKNLPTNVKNKKQKTVLLFSKQ